MVVGGVVCVMCIGLEINLTAKMEAILFLFYSSVSLKTWISHYKRGEQVSEF